MFLAVAIPVLLKPSLPELPTPIVRNAFNAVENLPDESTVLIALDYDPASRPELGPMNKAIVRHCAERGHKMFFITLWPLGGPMIQDAIRVLEEEFPEKYTYGENYLNLGFRAGNEAVVRLIVNNLSQAAPLDTRGQPLPSYPITRGVRHLLDMDLMISIGAGYPGTKEWVQFAVTPNSDQIQMIAGITGVSAPPLYPYYPQQIIGMLPAIKGAAEYEWALAERYPAYQDEQFTDALKRMGPQLYAHLLMLALIVFGNIIFFLERRRGIAGPGGARR